MDAALRTRMTERAKTDPDVAALMEMLVTFETAATKPKKVRFERGELGANEHVHDKDGGVMRAHRIPVGEYAWLFPMEGRAIIGSDAMGKRIE